MTAVAVPGWEPIESRLLTIAEAAAEYDVDRQKLSYAVRRGVVEGVKVAGHWLAEEASVVDWMRRPVCLRLPAEPLLERVRVRGGMAACGVRSNSAEARALLRAARSGVVTPRAADQLAVRVLGLTPAEVWSD